MLPTRVVSRSPFGGCGGGSALVPRPMSGAIRGPSSIAGAGAAEPGLQRKSSMESGMQRQMSRSLSGNVGATLTRGRSTACHGLGTITEGSTILDLLTDPGAASASFDDVCEVLGDVAKLDTLSNAMGSSLLQQQGLAAASALKALVTNNAALSWVAEKAAANLHQFSLLEGLVDKTLLDLFQQLYGVLDLDGTVLDAAPVRLAAAAGVALLVRHVISRHQAEHGSSLSRSASGRSNSLARQLSPAASLSDVLADTAAAAIISRSVRGGEPRQQQGLAFATASAGGSMVATAMPAAVPAASASSPFAAAISAASATAQNAVQQKKAAPSAFKAVSSSLLAEAHPADKARVAAHSLLTCMLLGQFKRCNKLKRKVMRAGADLSAGQVSPTALLACIEGAVLLHNYSELCNGLSTLLHIGA